MRYDVFDSGFAQLRYPAQPGWQAPFAWPTRLEPGFGAPARGELSAFIPGDPSWRGFGPELGIHQIHAMQAAQAMGLPIVPPQGIPALGLPAYGMPAHGMPAHGMPGFGVPTYGMPAQAMPAPIPSHSAPGYGIPGYGIPAYGIPAYGVPAYGIPGYGIPGYGIPGSLPAQVPVQVPVQMPVQVAAQPPVQLPNLGASTVNSSLGVPGLVDTLTPWAMGNLSMVGLGPAIGFGTMPPGLLGRGMVAPSELRFRGRGPKGYLRSDERIRDDVNDRLTEDPRIDATLVEVEVRNGEVTLQGTVETKWAKRIAEDLADTVAGVREVQNRLRVEQPERGLDFVPNGEHARQAATERIGAR